MVAARHGAGDGKGKDMNASERIDQLIAGIDDWRGKTFAKVREAILAADPAITEDWKWMGSPVWYRDGIIAVANAHKGKVKLTFMHGARLPDPDRLFNAGLEGNARRAIDYLEGDAVDEPALKRLIRAAIAFNEAKSAKGSAAKKPAAAGKATVKKPAARKNATAKQMAVKKAVVAKKAAAKGKA
jgi:hypothetical protein